MEKALFDWPIMLQYDVKAKQRLISRKFSDLKFFSPEDLHNQPNAKRICFCLINQSNHSISVRLLCLFCSRVFVSRTFENRSFRVEEKASIWLREKVKASMKRYRRIFVNQLVLQAVLPEKQISYGLGCNAISNVYLVQIQVLFQFIVLFFCFQLLEECLKQSVDTEHTASEVTS